MMNLKVEYLVILKDNDSFCNTVESFKHLLESNSKIKISKNEITWDGKKFGFIVVTDTVKDRNQRYFKLKLEAFDEKIIPEFQELLKILHELIYKAEGIINIIWDDISNYYSIKAYPEINKIENLLRKLITSFMLTNFGVDWTKEATPQEVKSTIKRRDKNDNSNYLHDTDFIQLADFLFKPYPTKDINILFKDLKKTTKIEDLNLEILKEYVPKSNWERYFKSFVSCDDDFLNKKWIRLYELRCIIAHNNFLSKIDFDLIIEIVETLTEKFEQAIDNLDKIFVPKTEQNLVLENAVKARNEDLTEFFKEWNEIYDEVKKLYLRKGFELENKNEDMSLKKMVNILVDNSILSDNFRNLLFPIGEFREKLNSVMEDITDEEVMNKTEQIKNFNLLHVFLEEPFIEDVFQD